MKFKYFLLIILVGLGLYFFLLRPKEDVNLEETEEGNKISVAVCPTYYEAVDGLGEEYKVVKTQSTLESLQLLDSGTVDFAIGGRTPKLGEEQFKYTVLDDTDRYSFLFKESIAITEKELVGMVVYTDQDVDKIKEIFGIENVKRVDDIYKYVEDSVTITSWDNTDYSKAEIVHLLDSDGNRNPNSRIPILYYREGTDIEKFDLSKIDI